MINAGVVQLKSVKKLEEEILEIDKKLEELKNERRIKVLLVQAVKLELVSYHLILSVITLPLGRSPQVSTLKGEKVKNGERVKKGERVKNGKRVKKEDLVNKV